MSKKIKIDPNKVIKVYPKMISESFKLMEEKSAKQSKIKLPHYNDLTISDINYLKNYMIELINYIK